MEQTFIVPAGIRTQEVRVMNATDGDPKGYQQVSVTASATGLTVPSEANRAIISVDTDSNIRWRDDGTDPTATVGMPLFAGASLILGSALSLSQFKAISDSGTTVNINVSYYKK